MRPRNLFTGPQSGRALVMSVKRTTADRAAATAQSAALSRFRASPAARVTWGGMSARALAEFCFLSEAKSGCLYEPAIFAFSGSLVAPVCLARFCFRDLEMTWEFMGRKQIFT